MSDGERVPWARLAAIHHDAFAAQDHRGWSAAELATLAATPGAALVSDPATPPQGFALLRAVAGEAELLTLAVAPAARRRGLGAWLMAHVERRAAALGALELFLEVRRDNLAALSLYRRRGFDERGLRRGYYGEGPGSDALILVKAL